MKHIRSESKLRSGGPSFLFNSDFRAVALIPGHLNPRSGVLFFQGRATGLAEEKGKKDCLIAGY